MSAISLAVTFHTILSESPHLQDILQEITHFTGLTPHGTAHDHIKAVRAGSQSLCPWFGPGVLMLAHLSDVAKGQVAF